MEPYRRDGRSLIAGFQRRGRTYRAPALLVHDRTVTRIYGSGGRLSLVHNIIQVLSKEGIERWGEVRVPRRARVLTLRTVKADGTVREPEEVTGKASVSVPDLEIGDFVEMEYLEPEPQYLSVSGAEDHRFYFGSFEVPMVLSEYLVVAPANLALIIESRGGAPRPEERREGDLVIRRFGT